VQSCEGVGGTGVLEGSEGVDGGEGIVGRGLGRESMGDGIEGIELAVVSGIERDSNRFVVLIGSAVYLGGMCVFLW